MTKRKKIQLYSAGCQTCGEAEAVVRQIAGTDHDVEVLEMHQIHIANQATRQGIRSLPAVVVDGRLVVAPLGGIDEAALRSSLG